LLFFALTLVRAFCICIDIGQCVSTVFTLIIMVHTLARLMSGENYWFLKLVQHTCPVYNTCDRRLCFWWHLYKIASMVKITGLWSSYNILVRLTISC